MPQPNMPICPREVCCLPGAQAQHSTRKLPRQVQLQAVTHCCSSMRVAMSHRFTHSPGIIKRDFRAWGWLVRDSETQVLSSVLPVVGSDIERDGLSLLNTWLGG